MRNIMTLITLFLASGQGRGQRQWYTAVDNAAELENDKKPGEIFCFVNFKKKVSLIRPAKKCIRVYYYMYTFGEISAERLVIIGLWAHGIYDGWMLNRLCAHKAILDRCYLISARWHISILPVWSYCVSRKTIELGQIQLGKQNVYDTNQYKPNLCLLFGNNHLANLFIHAQPMNLIYSHYRWLYHGFCFTFLRHFLLLKSFPFIANHRIHTSLNILILFATSIRTMTMA